MRRRSIIQQPQDLTEENPSIYEAIGRLDRIQAFHRDTLAAGAIRFCLDESCRKLLMEWVRGHLTGELSPYVVELRQELIRELYAYA